MDLLLDSLDGLVGERLVLEHCAGKSAIDSYLRSLDCMGMERCDLQKASSSSVRPWVSG
jgi:hypothetical protein